MFNVCFRFSPDRSGKPFDFFLVFLEQKERPTEAPFCSIEKQKKNQKLGTNSWIGFKL
jgi:hypothetical protein